MSNPISALGGKVAPGEVTVRDMGLQGMITLRGDLSNKALRRACTDLTGASFPDKLRAEVARDKGLCWMAPDEVLVLVPHADAGAALTHLTQDLDGQHHLACNVSDARVLLSVEGSFSREVMGKLSPVGLHPDAFGVGDFRRSKLGQVAAAFWMNDEETFQVICFRSVAAYAFDLLAHSAKSGPVHHLG